MVVTDYHPNRQLRREKWIDLNGEWSLKFNGNGAEHNYKIIVPYCPESEFSGVAYKDFIKECVYERTFSAPSFCEDERVILHFGAVDHEAKVYVNGSYVGRHIGGYTPFSFDVTDYLVSGENHLKVKVYDDVSDNILSGKQSEKPYSFGCFYTRCTGIWQTVWLEVVKKVRILNVKYYPNVDDQSVDVEIRTSDSGNINIVVSFGGKVVGECCGTIEREERFRISLKEKHLWDEGQGNLYDVKIKFDKDEVDSYFGMRSVGYADKKFLLNGRSVFQRLVLDQGYYPGGVYTPKDPSDFALDIERALRLGFNGIRLHQKVFDPEYLYYCDKMGVMVWGEFPSWGIRYSDLCALGQFTKEWTETVERDFNHPSVITWCPLNEVWDDIKDNRSPRDVRFVDAVYTLTKEIDTTRPCVDVSGGHHGHKTDLYDFHCYGEYDELKKILKELCEENELHVPMLYNEKETELRYDGNLPVHISEFGGKRFGNGSSVDGKAVSTCNNVVTATDDWGYGESLKDEKQFADRYEEIVKLLLSCKNLCGFCYTQLYDIEQEQNGLYTYDRNSKFKADTLGRMEKCNLTTASVEEE